MNPKNPSQCAERWKNFLSKKYKKYFFIDFHAFHTFNSEETGQKRKISKFFPMSEKMDRNGADWQRCAQKEQNIMSKIDFSVC